MCEIGQSRDRQGAVGVRTDMVPLCWFSNRPISHPVRVLSARRAHDRCQGLPVPGAEIRPPSARRVA